MNIDIVMMLILPIEGHWTKTLNISASNKLQNEEGVLTADADVSLSLREMCSVTNVPGADGAQLPSAHRLRASDTRRRAGKQALFPLLASDLKAKAAHC